MYVSHLNFPPRKARCGQSDSTSFSTLSYKSHHFLKMLLSGIYVSSFLYNTVREIFVLRIFYRELIKKCISVFKYGTHYFYSIFMIFKFSRHFFRVFSIIKLHEFPSSAIRVISKEWHKGRAKMMAIRQLNWWLSLL